jgi:asparagine synthase (glutamine-hydrolysing)
MQAEELGRTTVSLIYTGEVYNFVELRDELKQFGHRFKTRSDTEVVYGVSEFGVWIRFL